LQARHCDATGGSPERLGMAEAHRSVAGVLGVLDAAVAL